jgi:DNA-binding PucR family transcriptional regulator
VCYDDVAIVALALRDPERAKEFVADELGALAGDDPRSTLLRETLRAYFSSGANAAAAGARLGVHDRTVANRLQAVERHLLDGRSINARRDELNLALRLHQLPRRGSDDHATAT